MRRLRRRRFRSFSDCTRAPCGCMSCACTHTRWVLCGRARGYQGRIRRRGPRGLAGRAARFRFDPYRSGEGPGGRTTPTPGYALGGGEWFVCLFRENGRAAIGKNFIYMIEKCCPAEERARGPEEDAASRPIAPRHPSPRGPPSPLQPSFTSGSTFFFLHPGERASERAGGS